MATEDKTIPALNTADFAKEFNTKAKIVEIITNGSKVTGATGVISMPSFKTKFTPAQIDEIATYVMSLSKTGTSGEPEGTGTGGEGTSGEPKP